MIERKTIKAGLKCAKCGKDDWIVFQGFNRCACGQSLWIEKVADNPAKQFRYEQGAELPEGYQGWLHITR